MLISRVGLLHLLVVYLVWSSTYLAFKIGLLNGFEPLWMGATRFIPAALLLLLYARWRGRQFCFCMPAGGAGRYSPAVP